ncbi:hypothetical protein KIH23_09955 [Flavobacterium sp. CYK-55]|uniref:hypothetical protein n=1 Tax=Flavobacterium sp. CYK-55 TaxID=2835529 RepID=UPI001BCDD6CF|nr:hypothetical protein [Flavobacterium sp. CYK-55]MBS7787620.1 hypothetical protein [Flavobacterium sp. CYK-55]
MKLRKKIEITLVAALGVSLMLLIVLLTHFAMSQPLDKSQLEISKFEFQKPLSSADKIEIKMLMQSIPGMGRDIIICNNSMVCFHDSQSCNKEEIIQKLCSTGKYNARKIHINDISSVQLARLEAKGKFHHLAVAIRDPF